MVYKTPSLAHQGLVVLRETRTKGHSTVGPAPLGIEPIQTNEAEPDTPRIQMLSIEPEALVSVGAASELFR